MISACTGIPYRLLTGVEQGELASTKDQDNWNTRVDARRNSFCTNQIIRPFFNRLIQYRAIVPPGGSASGDVDEEGNEALASSDGTAKTNAFPLQPAKVGTPSTPSTPFNRKPLAKPKPAKGDGTFDVDWPTAREEKPIERAQTAVQRMTACQVYLTGNVETLIPKKKFLMDELDMDEEQAEEYLTDADVAAAQDSMDAQRDAATATAQAGADTAKAGADHAGNIAKASKNPENATKMQMGAGGMQGPGGKPAGSSGMSGAPTTIKPTKPVKGSDSPSSPTSPKAPGGGKPKGNVASGLMLNMAVDALMPDGERIVGFVIGADENGNALMRVNGSDRVIALPEKLKGDDHE